MKIQNTSNKIIFIYVNNTVRSIFNKKVVEKWVVRPVNSAWVYYSRKNTQKLQWKKKKKHAKVKTLFPNPLSLSLEWINEDNYL